MNKLGLFSLLLITMVTMLTTIQAYCPNGCNGQGTCGPKDKCTCYVRADVQTDPAYIGADCSQRTCPKGKAWADEATAANVAHAPAECSNAGLCDRDAGICACFQGFEGKACERSSCPNQCSGKGVCTLQSQLIYDMGSVNNAGRVYTTAWDARKIQGCVCDLGFRGADCSEMECPSGLDVMLGYGNVQGRDCGGRGLCDRETGSCECFAGYYGTACSYQTTVF